MKSTAKSSQVLVLLLLSLLVMQEVAECRNMHEGSESNASSMSRKILEGLRRDARRLKIVARDEQEVPEDWELRKIPAGPDPLHHHGGTTPSKP